MARVEVKVAKSDTVLDELNWLHQTISQRAYDLFRAGANGVNTLADWLGAERELIARPAVELSQIGEHFAVQVALPGVEAKDLDVQITPDDLLIKVETTSENTSDKGAVHVSEFSSGRIFRSIRFPERVDPGTVRAEYKNGMLRVTAAIAKAVRQEKVDVKAA